MKQFGDELGPVQAGDGSWKSHSTILYLYFSIIKYFLKKNLASSTFSLLYFLNIQMLIMLCKQK